MRTRTGARRGLASEQAPELAPVLVLVLVLVQVQAKVQAQAQAQALVQVLVLVQARLLAPALAVQARAARALARAQAKLRGRGRARWRLADWLSCRRRRRHTPSAETAAVPSRGRPPTGSGRCSTDQRCMREGTWRCGGGSGEGQLVFPTKVVRPYAIGAVKRPCATGIEAGTFCDADPSDRLPSVPMAPRAVLAVT